MGNTILLSAKVMEAVECAKFIYKDKWKETRQDLRKSFLIPHHKKHKTKNLLVSALTISKSLDEKEALALIASAI